MNPNTENPAFLDSIDSYGWTYSLYDRRAPLGSFPGFDGFHKVWRDKAGERSMPAWSDFDFYDFRGWHGWVYLGEVTEDRQDFRFRLFGTHIVELLADDYTGRLFSQVEEGPAADKEVEMTLLRRQIHEGLAVHMQGAIDWQERNYQLMETLALPLADDDRTTSHILAVTQKR